jgi:hypothetical protein
VHLGLLDYPAAVTGGGEIVLELLKWSNVDAGGSGSLITGFDVSLAGLTPKGFTDFATSETVVAAAAIFCSSSENPIHISDTDGVLDMWNESSYFRLMRGPGYGPLIGV